MARSSIALNWKVIATPRTVLPRTRPNHLFNISPSPGLFSRLGVAADHMYVGQNLQPTNTFHQVLQNMLHSNGIDFEGNRLPILLPVKGIGDVRLNLKIRIYLPAIVVLEVQLSPVESEWHLDRWINWQLLDQLKPVSRILRFTIGLVETLDHKDLPPDVRFKYKPGVRLLTDPSDHSGSLRRELAGLLIRNQQFDEMHEEIVESIWDKNEPLNYKSPNQPVLVDKQGLLDLSTADSMAEGKTRFERAFDLFEVGLVFSSFLRRYQGGRSSREDLLDFLLSRISPWIRQPNVVLDASVTHRLMWQLLVTEFGLEEKLSLVLNPSSVSQSLEDKSPYFANFVDSWWANPEFEMVLSDAISESRGVELHFLGDEVLKRIITNDMQEAQRSFLSKNYKATLVLSGSVIEAVVVGALLKQVPNLSNDKAYRLSLSEALTLAQEHLIIRDPHLLSLLDPVRKWRNAIHPGLEARAGFVTDEDRASIALRSISLLIKELSTNSQLSS